MPIRQHGSLFFLCKFLLPLGSLSLDGFLVQNGSLVTLDFVLIMIHLPEMGFLGELVHLR